jgi:hypothetical protein
VKIDVKQVIRDLQGEPLKNPKGEDTTLRWAFTEALLASSQGDENLSGEEKYNRYKLAKKVNASDEVELSVEEAAQIKKLLPKGFTPVLVGPVFDMIEAAAEAKPKLEAVPPQ